ncbi:MAG: 4Fe-4S dicluster domain-containing protein [Eubacteriales bacterium]|nr:4Fe-4S dicluster domain-containing protein [Eubacteriales bacterium]
MELKEIMKDAGIVGAGGAGFPSYAKLAEGADTLVINGAECEPLLYIDYIILRDELSYVLRGIGAVLEYAKIGRALLCVKQHTAERLGYEDGQLLADRICVKILPNVYPMGDEISLIYQATGRVVRAGNLPITAGVIVYNVETMYNVAKAIDGEKLTMKWLMIGGDVKKPITMRVPIGTRISDLFKKYGVSVKDGESVLDGGPAMGRLINPATAVVTKTTKSILILPDNIPAIETKKMDYSKATARAETACCQCTRCTDMCPRALLGYPLEPHKMVRTAKSAAEVMPEMVKTATLCCGCGICETIACCQDISPKAVIANYKLLLAKNKMRYSTTEESVVSDEREYRMVQSEKWESVLGVAKFDKVAEYIGEDRDFSQLEMKLSQHIGAPSVAVVSAGDSVKEGDMIARASDGLSLPLYAPMDAKVMAVDDKTIVLSK